MNTTIRRARQSLVAAALAAPPAAAHAGLPTATGTAIDLAESGYTLWIPSSYQSRGNVADLMVFYHGDPATVRNNLEYSNLNTILLTVNLGGFSSSYQTPYQGHPELFGNIINEAKTLTRNYFANQNLSWDKVGVSTFRAGWAAMREILKDPTNYNTISSYAALDTIYASFTNGTTDETPLASQMVDFKHFALDAKNGAKTMVLNHTLVQTYTYANTMQCADDINGYLGLAPVSYTTPGLGNATHDMSFYRSTSSGNYLMYGMTGDDANAHSVNLQESGQFLTETALANKNFTVGDSATAYSFDVGLAAGLVYNGTTIGRTISGQVQIPRRGGDHTINVADGSAASDLIISNRIFGLGTMAKSGAGTLTLSGSTANTLSGLTRVDAGVLELNKTAGVAAVAGNLTLQNGTARWLQSNQVADTALLTVSVSTSLADLNGKSDTIGALTLSRGIISLGAGTLTVTGAFNTINSFGTPTVSGAGTLIAASLDAQGGLSRSGGGVTRLTGSTLTLLAGRKIDLTDTRFITKAAIGSWNGAAYTGVTGMIQTGRNGGDWNGSGIVTSMTAAGTASGLTTLAIAANSVLGKTTFGGQSVGSSDVLVMYTYAGDTTLDGRITGDDYFRIDNGYATHASGYVNGDLNYDGKINADDYYIIDHNYGHQSGTFAAGSLPEGVAAVPEPGAAAFFALISAALLSRRIRRSHLVF